MISVMKLQLRRKFCVYSLIDLKVIVSLRVVCVSISAVLYGDKSSSCVSCSDDNLCIILSF